MGPIERSDTGVTQDDHAAQLDKRAAELDARDAALAEREDGYSPDRADTAADNLEAAPAPVERPDAEVCPKCGAADDNPTFETLPHCWKCGYIADDDKRESWPPADLDRRRRRAHGRRIGLPDDLLDPVG